MAEIISCGLPSDNRWTAVKPRNPHRSNSRNHFMHLFVTAHFKRTVYPNWKFTVCFFKVSRSILLKDSDCTDPCLPFNIKKKQTKQMELQEPKTAVLAAEAVLAVNCVMQELFFFFISWLWRLKSACTHGWISSLVPALLQVPVVPSEGL